MDARIFVLANKDVVKFEATAGADSWIFNKKKSIFRATGSIGGDNRKANGKGEVYAKLSINIIGKNYVLYNKKAQGIKYAKEKSFQKSFSYKVFHDVVVPCSLEVGASFNGIRYSLNILATRIEAAVTPFLNSDAFARFAIDVGVASAGIEGRVTLLDAEAKLHGEAGVSGDNQGLYAYASVAADLGIAALQGSINAVATVKWCIFGCKKTYRRRSSAGVARKNWNLFKVEADVHFGRGRGSGHPHQLWVQAKSKSMATLSRQSPMRLKIKRALASLRRSVSVQRMVNSWPFKEIRKS